MERPVGDALSGDLECFSLSDVLQVLGWGQKTGTLMVESEGVTYVLHFDKGQVVASEESGPCRRSLNEVLEKSGRLANEQAQRIIRLRRESPKRADQTLVSLGILARPILEQHQRLRIAEAVSRLFMCRTGRYRFDPRVQREPEDIATPCSIENLILEGVRASDEWQVLRTKIASLEVIPKWVQTPGGDAQKAKVSPAEWRILSLANGRNTIRNIAELLLLNELEVARAVYGFLNTGLVTIVGTAPPPVNQTAAKWEAPAVPVAEGAQPRISLDLNPMRPDEVTPPLETVPSYQMPERTSNGANAVTSSDSGLGEIIGKLVEQAQQASQVRQQDVGKEIIAILEKCRVVLAMPVENSPQLELAALVPAIVDCGNDLLVHRRSHRFEEAGNTGDLLEAITEELEEELYNIFAQIEESFPALDAVQVTQGQLDARDLITTYALINGEARSEFYREAIRGLTELIGAILDYVLHLEITVVSVSEECRAVWQTAKPLIDARLARLIRAQQSEDQKMSSNARRRR